MYCHGHCSLSAQLILLLYLQLSRTAPTLHRKRIMTGYLGSKEQALLTVVETREASKVYEALPTCV
jgi:hypothetical protein